MASRVGPAVIRIRLPLNKLPIAQHSSKAANNSAGSNIRPGPLSPHACSPDAGPKIAI